MEKNNNLILITIITMLFMLLITGCGEQEDFYVEQPEADAETMKEEDSEKEIAEAADIYVQVCGAVRSPGVYSLKAGSRIFEAVEMAGGLLEEADLTAVNQAQVLEDGQMVYVYAEGEAEGPRISENIQAEDGKININTASAEELMTLPGIGQAKAASIISWRETHGNYQQIEDIMNVEGIKEGVFSKVKDRIKVN